MSELESLEKLRNGMGGYGTGDNNFVTLKKEAFDRYCDAIQAEVDERYMKLPVDADGVPIHVGDVVEFGENLNQGIVKALNEHMVIAMHVDDCCMNYAKYGLLWNADACRHVKPRTVEDVLLDFLKESRDFNLKHTGEVDEAIKRYSAELQMRGDAE